MNTAFAPMSDWNTLPWRRIERQVFKLQKRIYQASQRGDRHAVRSLQRLMTTSWAAKCLPEKAPPTRRVWIPKPGSTEQRPLGIPTLQDRAAQALAKLALEPEWEARFEPNSYGFRPGRSVYDAVVQIHIA